MTMLRKQRKYSIGGVYVKWLYNRFYKKFEVVGMENVPKDTPIILAPNHQNALMDALSLVSAFDKQVVFLARADIFKKPFIAWLLTGLRTLPVYRIRDGISNLNKNDEIFDRSVEIIKHNQPFCLFPEARHNNKRFLLPLKKAVPRIAFKAESAENFSLNIHIIPIGMYYSSYSNFRSVQVLNIGKPILISDYKKAFEESEQIATKQLTDDLTKSIKELIIDITDHENNDTYEEARNIYNWEFLHNTKDPLFKHKHKAYTKLKADQKIVNGLLEYHEDEPEKFNELKDKIDKFTKIVKDNNLRNWVFRKDTYSWSGILFKLIGLLILTPIHLAGIALFAIPHNIIRLATKKIFKDPQFYSTSKYLFTLVLLPFYLLILGLIFDNILNPSWLAWALLPLVPAVGVYAFEHMVYNRKVRAQMRYNIKISRKNKSILEAKQLRKEIVEIFDALFNFNK